MYLSDIIPDEVTLLALESEELAGAVLEKLHEQARDQNREMVHPQNNGNVLVSKYTTRREECLRAVSEAWSILVAHGFLARDPSQMGSADWYFITRRGQQVRSRTDFRSLRHAGSFPRDSVHPDIAEKSYALFIRGEYENAVFQSCKAVEVAVRSACGDRVRPEELGTGLMRAAFNPDTGHLRNPEEPSAEQKALADLFAGRLSQILCLSIFLGVVELLLKTDHKLAHRLFPILDRHRPALTDIAQAQIHQFDRRLIVGKRRPRLAQFA